MIINREIESKIVALFGSSRPKGLILAGIVGCGKTTVARRVIKMLPEYTAFEFSGDDSRFRATFVGNSLHLLNEVISKTQKKAIIFVDEVQKWEEIDTLLAVI